MHINKHTNKNWNPKASNLEKHLIKSKTIQIMLVDHSQMSHEIRKTNFSGTD